MLVKFQDMEVPMAIRTPEYLKSLYGNWCLVEALYGKKV